MLTCTVVLELECNASCLWRGTSLSSGCGLMPDKPSVGWMKHSTVTSVQRFMRAEAIVSLHEHVQSEGGSLPLNPSSSRSEKAHYAQGARYVVDLGLTKILLHDEEHL
jgi:hypothetical protein